MKYFTPELYLRLQLPSPEEMDAADAAWDEAHDRYEERIQQILPHLPEHIRFFLDELRLHDADVKSIARQEDKLLMVLRKDIPPRNLVILTYTLAAEPVINTTALPEEYNSCSMQFMYDEFDVEQEGGRRCYTESILFSNGWEIQLKFTDVQVTQAKPLYPVAEALRVEDVMPEVPQLA